MTLLLWQSSHNSCVVAYQAWLKQSHSYLLLLPLLLPQLLLVSYYLCCFCCCCCSTNTTHWARKHSNRFYFFLLKLVHREPSSCIVHNLIIFHLVSIYVFNLAYCCSCFFALFVYLCCCCDFLLLRVCNCYFSDLFFCQSFSYSVQFVSDYSHFSLSFVLSVHRKLMYIFHSFNRKQQMTTIYIIFSVNNIAMYHLLNRLNYFAIISYCFKAITNKSPRTTRKQNKRINEQTHTKKNSNKEKK